MGLGGHDFERVDDDDEGFVLTCRCGWRSPKRPSARAVGDEWDRHRGADAEVSERRTGG